MKHVRLVTVLSALLMVVLVVSAFAVPGISKRTGQHKAAFEKGSVERSVRSVRKQADRDERGSLGKKSERASMRVQKEQSVVPEKTSAASLIQTITFYDWVDGEWTMLDRWLYTYDSNGNVTEDKTQVYENSVWVDTERILYKLNANGNVLEEVNQIMEDGEWISTDRMVYTRDENGNETVTLYQNYEDEKWVDSSRMLTTWSLDQIVDVTQYRDADGNSWMDEYKDIYKLNESGDNVEEQYLYYDGGWLDYQRVTIAYHANGQMDELLIYEITDGSEILYGRETYAYDEWGNVTEWIYAERDDSAWDYVNREAYTYDENGSLVYELWQDWDGFHWINTDDFEYTYNEAGDDLAALSHVWDGSAWVNDIKWEYGYEGTDVADLRSSVSPEGFTLVNYPNPFNPETTIEFNLAQRSVADLFIYDVQGRQVRRLLQGEMLESGMYHRPWNGRDDIGQALPSGVYIIYLKTDGQSKTIRSLLMK